MQKTNNMDHAILLTGHKVTSAETDMYNRLRLGSLINYLIQAAISSADSLGFGFENLIKQKLFWVLSRLTVEIYKPLKWYDELTVETWPKDIRGILHLRDFIVRDNKNEIISNATSGWLAIDLETKRPARSVESINSDVFRKLKEKHALKYDPDKFASVNNGEIFEVNSTYFDIDANKHVTSTRYIDWMVDTFPVDFHRNNYPEKVSINYLKETKPDEKLTIKRKTISEKKYSFEGTNLNNSSTAFRGEIVF